MGVPNQWGDGDTACLWPVFTSETPIRSWMPTKFGDFFENPCLNIHLPTVEFEKHEHESRLCAALQLAKKGAGIAVRLRYDHILQIPTGNGNTINIHVEDVTSSVQWVSSRSTLTTSTNKIACL